MVYTSSMLIERYKDFADPYDKIRRECDNGNLIKVIRGLYEDDRSVPPYRLASYIYGPSYISFDYIMSSRGLIPERAVNITSATFRKNKSRKYVTPFGTYIYHDVPGNVFRECVEYHSEENYVYMTASLEKALCDKLYTVRQVNNMSELEQLIIDDLRIDLPSLYDLDLNEIFRIAPLYRRKNLKLLCRFLGGKQII